MPGVLDLTVAQKTSYAVPLWLRDEQIKVNSQRVKGRIQPHYALRSERIAVACFGPSLNETWAQIKDFSYVISCSGSHRFLLERGIVPTWHLEVDPRKHKVTLMGAPHPEVEYLISSTCHPAVLDHLEGFTVKLWHVFDTAEEGRRILPPGEWALTGGCSVGLRALTMARFLGFTDLHVFGMDGCDGPSGKHAAAHPNQAKDRFETVYKGKTYYTTPGFLEAARTTFHELDQMSDVRATFYGEGLVQDMAKDYVPKHQKGQPEIAFVKPELISDDYRDLNARLHRDNLAYGVGGGKHAEVVGKLVESTKAKSVLDYGAGKGYLAKALDFPIWEYDPAIPEKSASPRAADLVVCTDVLEHIEPEKLGDVLRDLKRCVKQLGYFVIHTGPAHKTLPDGRNTHLIQQNQAWWTTALSNCFTVAKIWPVGKEICVLVAPLKGKAKQTKLVKPAQPANPMGLRFANLVFRRDPYPVGVATEVLDPSLYHALVSSFPAVELFKKFTGADEKYSLSERNHPQIYEKLIRIGGVWHGFHAYIKSAEFLAKMGRVLASHKVPIDVSGLRARFEFSSLPANGGYLRPHTDIPSKVATLVIAMPSPDAEWDPAWGGGTAIYRQTDQTQVIADYAAQPGDLERVHVYDYRPNHCVLFVKTAQSWHAVEPLTGPEGQWRNTVTINLERV